MELAQAGPGVKRRRGLRELVPVAVWVVTVAATIGLISAVVLIPEQNMPNAADRLAIPFFAAMILSLGTVGGLLSTRRPENVIGWLLLFSGLCMAFALLPPALITYLQATKRSIAGLEWPGLIGIALFQVGLILAGSVILVFPSGRLDRRGRPVMATIGVGLVLSLLASLLDPLSNSSVGLSNPLSTPALAPLAPPLNAIGSVLLVFAFCVAAALLVLRLRKSQGDERRQLAWFAYCAVILAIGLPISSLPLGDFSAAAFIVVIVAFAALPIAIAIAITKYRLYEIDRLINRTLVYVPLLAILGGVFAALTVMLQKLFVQLTGDTSDTAVVLATLVVAGTFAPLRKSLDAWAERRFKARPGASGTASGATATGVGVDVLIEDPRFIAAVEGVVRRVVTEPVARGTPDG